MFPEMAVEPIVVELPKQMPVSLPVTAAGIWFTVTVTLLLVEQPVAGIVSVRV